MVVGSRAGIKNSVASYVPDAQGRQRTAHLDPSDTITVFDRRREVRVRREDQVTSAIDAPVKNAVADARYHKVHEGQLRGERTGLFQLEDQPDARAFDAC